VEADTLAAAIGVLGPPEIIQDAQQIGKALNEATDLFMTDPPSDHALAYDKAYQKTAQALGDMTQKAAMVLGTSRLAR
jgi:hypothetical protein